MTLSLLRLRQHVAMLAILLITVLAAIILPARSRFPWIIYNASGSAPLGFYRVDHRLPARGDTVAIRPSKTLESLLVTHAVLPPGMPLLKRVAAIGGDRICRSAGVVFVNGEAVAEALERDRDGHPMPIWEGCFTLFEGQFFVVQLHPYSFDSRYFGPVSECQIIGIARPIWTWNADE
jgi:conjugative transfer signal peptidase TraF